MKENRKKITIPSLEDRRKKYVRSLEDIELRNRLIGSPEMFATDKSGDDYLDAFSLRIKLMGGGELSFEEQVSETINVYQAHFPKSFYYAIARLYGFPKEVMDKFSKPECAKYITMQFVYARFTKKVVDYLMNNTPWSEIPGVRAHKLFQRLSDSSIERLDEYIKEAEDAMNASSSLIEFKYNFSSKHKLSFQMDMFTDIPS